MSRIGGLITGLSRSAANEQGSAGIRRSGGAVRRIAATLRWCGGMIRPLGNLAAPLGRLAAPLGSMVLGSIVRPLRGFARRQLDRHPAMRDSLADVWEQVRENVHWYAASMVFHMLAFAVALLILGAMHLPRAEPAAGFTPVNDDLRVRPPLEPMESFTAPLDTSRLNTDDLTNPQFKVTSQGNAGSEALSDRGGGRQNDVGPDGGGFGGFGVMATGPGPIVRGGGGIGAGHGFGHQPGSGGDGTGFGGRGRKGEMLGRYGGTKNTENAVIAALNWFARHRNLNGSWSLTRFSAHCVGNPCTGPGSADSDVAATSLSLLTFLGAGQTHKSQGPYQPLVNQGIFWLIKHQARNGNLASGSPTAQMYAHALATLTLCECYGMTKDQKVGDAAALGVTFIEAAQNQATGGWRYIPQDPTGGDTSVLGWQIMALHSAQLAGVPVRRATLDNAKHFLDSVCKGNYRGLYSYQDTKEPTPTITAIGMLSWQYLGMRPDDPAMVEGKQYLLEHLPDNGLRNTYYWYYATQVMHNLMGHDWDTWNRPMRRALVESQCRHGCAAGSWDPEYPTLDTWGPQGGRIVTTAFSTLTLEVYYRYLPLFQEGGSASDPVLPAASSR